MNGNGHHDPPSVEETGENKLNGNSHEQPAAASNSDGQTSPALQLAVNDMPDRAASGGTNRSSAAGGRRPSLSRQHSARSAVSARSAGSARSRRRKHKEEIIMWPDPNVYNHRSFFLFPLDGIVRKAAIACIEWKWWDRIVLFFIFDTAGGLQSVRHSTAEPRFALPRCTGHHWKGLLHSVRIGMFRQVHSTRADRWGENVFAGWLELLGYVHRHYWHA